MTPIIRNSGNISTGEHHSFRIKLDEGFSNKIEIPALGFTKAAISVRSVQAVGTSGNVIAQQSIIKGGSSIAFSPVVSLAVGVTTNAEAYDIDISGQFFVVDLSGLTNGGVGILSIDVIFKRQ